MKDERKGFTLLELMVVVTIVGILAMVAFSRYMGFKYRAARSEAFHNLDAIRTCEEAYEAEHQRYVLCSWNPSGWTPEPVGTSAWNENSGFKSVGFRPKGKKKFKYAVDGYPAGTVTATWLGGNGDTSITDGEQGRSPSPGKQDICIMAVGDVDGDGNYSKLYLTDEPPGEVKDANPGKY